MRLSDSPLVLAVDDNPENLRLLCGILEEKGYTTAMATSGSDAMAFLLKEKPEIILLDIMMPVADGYEVCSWIKQSPVCKDIPVIFLTAMNETDNLVRGFEAGAVDYVTKPFSPPELLARIRTHIELRRARLEIKTLRGLLSVCANCKNIRNETGEWQPIESYVKDHSEAEFSHGLCPSCVRKLYPHMADKVLGNPGE